MGRRRGLREARGRLVLSGGRHGRREAIGRQALTYGGGTQANVTNTSVFWFQLLTRERALYVVRVVR